MFDLFFMFISVVIMIMNDNNNKNFNMVIMKWLLLLMSSSLNIFPATFYLKLYNCYNCIYNCKKEMVDHWNLLNCRG